MERQSGKSTSLRAIMAFVALLTASGFVPAQAPGREAEGEKLFGWTRLTPSEGAMNQEAAGSVLLFERGERMAIHVHVRRLEPGATYSVEVTRNDETAALGMITTRGEDDPPPPPRCFLARLSGAEEVPPVETRARGFGIFLLNRERSELRYAVFARGLSGPLVGAHIHAGLPGAEGDVVIPLDETDLRGSAAVTPEETASLAGGQFYVNLHTEANPEGEIRGQIEPCPVPRFHRGPRPGSGSLRLDTARGDTMPFAVETLSALTGALVTVENAAGKVVLSGEIGELMRLGRSQNRRREHQRGGEAEEEAAILALEDADAPADDFFDLPDRHDASFIRGDFNDDRELTLVDPLGVLNFLFLAGAGPYCLDAADATDDGAVDISDAVLILQRLFNAGGRLASPHPSRGFDGTPDALYCEATGG